MGGLHKAFRNLSGVEVTSVDNLNLLDLAPGGHLGRFCIWTKGAFEKLDALFGTYENGAELKKGFNLPHGAMTNADLARIINSDEIQSSASLLLRKLLSFLRRGILLRTVMSCSP